MIVETKGKMSVYAERGDIRTLSEVNSLLKQDICPLVEGRFVKYGFSKDIPTIKFHETLLSHPNSEALYLVEQMLDVSGESYQAAVYASLIPPSKKPEKWISKTSLHYHPVLPAPADEIYDLIDGNLVVTTVVDGKFKQYFLERGDRILIPAGRLHQAYTDTYAALFLVTYNAGAYPSDKLHFRSNFS